MNKKKSCSLHALRGEELSWISSDLKANVYKTGFTIKGKEEEEVEFVLWYQVKQVKISTSMLGNTYAVFHKIILSLKMKVMGPYPILQYLSYVLYSLIPFSKILNWVCPRTWWYTYTPNNPLLMETINSILTNIWLTLSRAPSHPSKVWFYTMTTKAK